jgi:hypothetical protein
VRCEPLVPLCSRLSRAADAVQARSPQVLRNVTAAPVLLTEANGVFLDSLDEPLLWEYAQNSLLLGRPDELYDIQNFTHPSTLRKLAPNPLDPTLLAGDQIATYQLVGFVAMPYEIPFQCHTKYPFNALMMIICLRAHRCSHANPIASPEACRRAGARLR